MERSKRFGLLPICAMMLPAAAWADLAGTPTLSAGQQLNVSSGVAGASGGDFQWTGTAINFLGSAKAFILSGNQTANFPNFTITQAQADASSMNQSPVGSPVAGTVFLMQANSGDFAKVLITAQSGTSVTLQYDTFSPAASGPITYTMAGTMQGGVNGIPFNGNFTWLVIADTSGITNPSNGMYQNAAIRSYLTIAGVGTLIPLQSTTVILNTTASTVTFNGGGAALTVPVAGSSFPSNLATVIGFVGSGPAMVASGNINTTSGNGGIGVNGVAGANAPKFQATNAPVIESISNAASNLLPGTTTAQLAQGSIFIIKGNALGPSTLFAAPDAQVFQSTTVSNTSVTVTVGTVTVNALMYYTSSGQVAALLPSSTPLGSGLFTVIYNGVSSTTMSHTIVASNLGLFTLDSTGQGPGIVTYPDYSFVSAAKAPNCTGPSNTGVEAFVPCGAANPGDTLILWATGLGPLPAGVADNSAGGLGVALNSVQLTLWLGGVSVPIGYQGRGCCFGEDQIVFTLPTTGTLVPTGCAVPLVAQINLGTTVVISNTVSIPVAKGSRNCTATDPVAASENLEQQVMSGALPFDVVDLELSRNPTGNGNTFEDDARFKFQKVLAVNTTFAPFFITYLDSQPLGTCVVYDSLNPNNNVPVTSIANADAGKSVTITGPTSSLVEAIQPGTNNVTLSNTGAFLNPGTFTINGAGGVDIGPFKATINIPGAPTLTSPTQGSAATGVSRSNGLPLTWTGGSANGVISITLQSASDITFTNGSTAYCAVSGTAGSFTIPPYVLEALNAGTSVPFSIEQDALPVPVTSTNIGFGELNFSGLGTGLSVNLQ